MSEWTACIQLKKVNKWRKYMYKNRSAKQSQLSRDLLITAKVALPTICPSRSALSTLNIIYLSLWLNVVIYKYQFYFAVVTRRCFWAVRLSVHSFVYFFVCSFVRMDIVTTISHERLEQSLWNIQRIFTNPHWWPDEILKVTGQGHCRPARWRYIHVNATSTRLACRTAAFVTALFVLAKFFVCWKIKKDYVRSKVLDKCFIFG